MNPSNLTIQVDDREKDQGPTIKGLTLQTSPFYTSSPITKSPVKRSPNEKKTLRARRPFKYLKHQGPRPIPSNPSNRIFYSNQTISIHDSNQTHSKFSRIRTSSNSDTRVPKRSTSSNNHNEPKSTNRINGNKPYSQISSRLLKSRNLNLSAIDTLACQRSKQPGVEVLHDEADSMMSHSGATHHCHSTSTSSPHRLSQHLSTSCFSAWSTTTSSTQLKSLSFLSLNSTRSSELQLPDQLEKLNVLNHNLPTTKVTHHQALQKRSISFHESNPSNW
ncbi:uncharacterized protein MELLADRAFT_71451 [Melampsora larici-populina 98AG31]|uniref:Uncharacterized protein n=1 Tax=Melampsora larici-populina (strain 98AG31 / pathotype 3-4-7) TaxID=747676 RepID=F4RG69_MELLP|nr:uncharacterized protein MELLADRAFT_71451 [Melampsora larici-populina 98AG31]EGG08596.1 hypothetical protein MELLADRAFT_71451 [Melampsora larici-populina 98AG31]